MNIGMTKGKPMPQTIAEWQYLYGLAEKAMLRDKEEISRLKCKVNRLEQKLKRGGKNETSPKS